MANLVPVVIGSLLVTVVVLLVKMRHLGSSMEQQTLDNEVLIKTMEGEQKGIHTRYVESNNRAINAEQQVKQLNQRVKELNDFIAKQDQDLSQRQQAVDKAQEELRHLNTELEEQKKAIKATEDKEAEARRLLEERTGELQKAQQNIKVYEENAKVCENVNDDLKITREKLESAMKEVDMWRSFAKKNAGDAKAVHEEAAKNEVKRSVTKGNVTLEQQKDQANEDADNEEQQQDQKTAGADDNNEQGQRTEADKNTEAKAGGQDETRDGEKEDVEVK